MRKLNVSELEQVSGSTYSAPTCCCPTTPAKTKKGNNGFGNGSDAPNLAAPGNSGGTPGNKNYSSVR